MDNVNEAVLVQLIEALREAVLVELAVRLVLTEGVSEGVSEFEKEKLGETVAELSVGVEDGECDNDTDPEVDKDNVMVGDKLLETEGVTLLLHEELAVELSVTEHVRLREKLAEQDKLELELSEGEKEID
eukprot:RCo010135